MPAAAKPNRMWTRIRRNATIQDFSTLNPKTGKFYLPVPAVPSRQALAGRLWGARANSLIESLLERVLERVLESDPTCSGIAGTSAQNLLALEQLGGDRRQLIDLLQQRLELGFAQMFAQTPIALLRTGDDRIMRRKTGCGQRDQHLAAVLRVR